MREVWPTANEVAFDALEYHSDGRFRRADFRIVGMADDGWQVLRNETPILSLGPGYRLLRSIGCGVCSTDLDRQFLPFPLPQITGHELIAVDETGRRYAIEINDSHRARGDDSDCVFCRVGLDTHCPDRRVLGIHDLPGGFGRWILAPSHALHEIPASIPSDTAYLIEPFAAALHAALRIGPVAGNRIAVLGPRRLGLLTIAALAAQRRRSGVDFDIVAVGRHANLLDLACALGANEHVLLDDTNGPSGAPIADVVIDTTGTPDGLDAALDMARHEVHLKSTHGQDFHGLKHLTELVVDEMGLQLWRSPDADGTVSGVSSLMPGGRARIGWLCAEPPPSDPSSAIEWIRARNAEELLVALEEQPARTDTLKRVDAVVTANADHLDQIIRPRSDSEHSPLRPRGQILLRPEPAAGHIVSPLVRAITRGLKLSTSRCGNFGMALDLLKDDGELQMLGEKLVTHHLPASRLQDAFEIARSPGCIKAVIDHPSASEDG
jgi:threonine dehydrogenase-like Zn-dependent dehydrogenase